MKDVPPTNSNTTVFVSIHAQSELLFQTDIVPEDVIQTASSWTTNVILIAQLDSISELTLLVLPNAQSVTSSMEKSVNLFHKTVHQDNSIMLKPVSALHAHILVLNVNTHPTIVQLAHQVSHSPQASALKPTAVELENSEPHQDHAQIAHKNVLNVSVPLNVPLALLDTSTMELTVS